MKRTAEDDQSKGDAGLSSVVQDELQPPSTPKKALFHPLQRKANKSPLKSVPSSSDSSVHTSSSHKNVCPSFGASACITDFAEAKFKCVLSPCTSDDEANKNDDMSESDNDKDYDWLGHGSQSESSDSDREDLFVVTNEEGKEKNQTVTYVKVPPGVKFQHNKESVATRALVQYQSKETQIRSKKYKKHGALFEYGLFEPPIDVKCICTRCWTLYRGLNGDFYDHLRECYNVCCDDRKSYSLRPPATPRPRHASALKGSEQLREPDKTERSTHATPKRTDRTCESAFPSSQPSRRGRTFLPLWP